MSDGEPVREDVLGASTFLEKGWNLISRGDFAAAEPALKRAMELSPTDAQATALMAWSLMHRARYADASACVGRAIRQQPSNALAYVGAGFIAMRQNAFGVAIEHLTKALRLDNDPKATLYAHYYLGLVYMEREMHSDARAFLERAIVLGPNLIEAHYHLGKVRWVTGSPDEARSIWNAGAKSSRYNAWGQHCAKALEAMELGQPFPAIQ